MNTSTSYSWLDMAAVSAYVILTSAAAAVRYNLDQIQLDASQVQNVLDYCKRLTHSLLVHYSHFELCWTIFLVTSVH